MRTWTDSSGLYKIEARFVELADGKVTLEKDDGTRKSMPLDKLWKTIKSCAKKLAAAAPQESVRRRRQLRGARQGSGGLPPIMRRKPSPSTTRISSRRRQLVGGEGDRDQRLGQG